MSYPENKLAKFQSYSAMHILVMCDGMATADLLQTDSSAFTENTDNPNELFDTHEITDPDPANSEFRGRYIVVFDGRRNANYSISSVEWETVLAPIGNDGESKFDQIETEGTMVIEEPFGVEFLETLVAGTRELEVDPSGVVFMLKTFFVGFDDNGQQHIIDDVLPFTFVMIDLVAEMKAQGSKYTITLFGTANGVSKLPQISSIGNGLIVKFKGGDTLAQAIEKFEIAIQAKYQVYRKTMLAALAKDLFESGNSTGNTTVEANQLVNERFSEVQYLFVIDPAYGNPEYIIGTNEADVAYADNEEFSIKFGPSSTVEDCIRKLLKSCLAVEMDSTVKKDATGKATSKLPKISTRLLPSPTNDTYVVEYTVNQNVITHQQPGVTLDPADGEYIEFDYIYTGKNTDILDFDIKMDMGLSFFQTNLGTKPQASTQKENSTGDGTIPLQAQNSGQRAKADATLGTKSLPPARRAPLFLGTTLKPSSFTNQINIGASMSFDDALTKQAVLENIQAQVKIVGNPQLLNETLSSADDGSEPNADGTSLGNMYKRPGLVKINIQFPSSKELTGVKKFWYDGYFNIFAIKNSFDSGVFTQTLDMFSLPPASDMPDELANQDVNTLPTPGSKSTEHFVNRADSEVDINEETETSRSLVFGRLPSNDGGNTDPKRDPNVDLFAKHGVLLAGVGPEITNIYDEIVDTWREVTGSAPRTASQPYQNVVPVITSGNDGRHKVGSLHGLWRAIDLRANNLAASQSEAIAIGKLLARTLSVKVGNKYDVIYENYPGNFANNHIHLEYDPKIASVKHETDSETGEQ